MFNQDGAVAWLAAEVESVAEHLNALLRDGWTLVSAGRGAGVAVFEHAGLPGFLAVVWRYCTHRWVHDGACRGCGLDGF